MCWDNLVSRAFPPRSYLVGEEVLVQAGHVSTKNITKGCVCGGGGGKLICDKIQSEHALTNSWFALEEPSRRHGGHVRGTLTK